MDPRRQGREDRGTRKDHDLRRRVRRGIPRLKKPSLWRNAGYKVFAEGTGRTLNFLLSVIGARVLGPASWGIYWSAFSFAQILSLFTDLGGHLTLTREASRRPRQAPLVLSRSLLAKVALSITVAAFWGISGGMPGIPIPLQGVLLGAVLAVSFTEWLGYYLRGLDRVLAESVILSIDCSVAFALGTAALLAGMGPLGLAFSQLGAHLLVFAFASAWARGLVRLPPGLPSGRAFLSFALKALPTGVATLALFGSWRMGIVALIPMGVSEESVGLFSAANRVIEAARFFPAAVAAGLFPAFASRLPRMRPWRALAFLLPPAFLAALFFQSPALSSLAVRLLYGPGYAGAERMLSILMLAFPFVTANSILTYWLVARGSRIANALVCLGHLAVNVTCLLLTVPSMGANGAALSFLIAEGFSAGCFFLLSLSRR